MNFICENVSSAKGRKLSCFLEVPKPDGFAGTSNSKEFRVRSKSLDDGDKRFYTDCETTYRIYETIVKEGKNETQNFNIQGWLVVMLTVPHGGLYWIEPACER